MRTLKKPCARQFALDFWQSGRYNLHNLNTVPSESDLEKAWYYHGRDQEVTRDTGNTLAELSPFPFPGRAGHSRFPILPLPVDSGEGFFFEIEDANVPGGHL